MKPGVGACCSPHGAAAAVSEQQHLFEHQHQASCINIEGHRYVRWLRQRAVGGLRLTHQEIGTECTSHSKQGNQHHFMEISTGSWTPDYAATKRGDSRSCKLCGTGTLPRTMLQGRAVV